MSELYVVRHAHAAGHDGGDPGLSELGRTQVERLAARLAGRAVVEIRHGPRRRAAETAELLSREMGGVPTVCMDLLDDRTPVPSRERGTDYPARFDEWLEATPVDEQDVDGASLSQALVRLTRDALALGDRGPLVCVTHAFVIGWFVRCVLDAPTWRWLGLNSDNTGLTVLHCHPDGVRLGAFNDTGHLSSPARAR